MRVLVTGASGFIGRWVLQELAISGCEVHAVSRQPLTEIKGVAWHAANVIREPSRIVRAVRPTHLIHLAWCTEPSTYTHSPHNAAWAEASISMVESFAACGGQHMVIAGTCAEYDLPTSTPCCEERTQICPRTPYAASKHALHVAARHLSDVAGVGLCWARLFYLFGPFERPERLVPALIRGVARGERLDLREPAATRDYLHSEDAAQALAALSKSGAHGVVNVGSGCGIMLGNLSSRIAYLMGYGEESTIGSPGASDLVVADVTRLRAWGIGPPLDLDQRLEQTIDWWRKN